MHLGTDIEETAMHKEFSIPSHNSQLIDQESLRTVGNFPWLGTVHSFLQHSDAVSNIY